MAVSHGRTREQVCERAYLDCLLVRLLVALEVAQGEPLGPVPLVEVHEHRLLELRLAVVDRDRVVVPVEPVDERLDGGLVDVPDVRRRLPRLKALQDHRGVDEPERVDHDFALDGLDGVDDDGDGPAVELLERLRAQVSSGSGAAPSERRLNTSPAAC